VGFFASNGEHSMENYTVCSDQNLQPQPAQKGGKPKKRKKWRVDIKINGKRAPSRSFNTKAERDAEAARLRLEAKQRLAGQLPTTQRDMGFRELLNRRMDNIKHHNGEWYYNDHIYRCRRWLTWFGDIPIAEITPEMVQRFIWERADEVSPYTANAELRRLRATFNFAVKWKYRKDNPTDGIQFIPDEDRPRYVPPAEDIEKVIALADPETQDYLVLLRETLARMSEINTLTWDDVDFGNRVVALYTRKKRGGKRTRREVTMTDRVFEILKHRHSLRHKEHPWIFWHSWKERKTGIMRSGPYTDRKDVMKKLCEKAGVRYFRYHALRHAGASLLDSLNVPAGTIQRILGHENRTTTEIYLHSLGNAEREAMMVFGQAVKTPSVVSPTSVPT